MYAVISRPGPNRWIGLVIAIGLVVPVCLAVLPGATGWIFARQAPTAAPTEAAIFTPAAAARQSDYPPDAGPAGVPNASADAIETMLGQLETRDEATLREPLLSMRLAEMALLSRADPRAGPQFSRWADVFSDRLAEMVLPAGTRASLAAKLTIYQHEVLGARDGSAPARNAEAAPRDEARAVEPVTENADLALPMSIHRQTEAFGMTRDQVWGLLGVAILVSMLLAAGGGFTLGRVAAHNRRLVHH
jgi:hypothetical protein